jgi:hypothetical protein
LDGHGLGRGTLVGSDDQDAVSGDGEGMLDMGAGQTIAGDHGPMVSENFRLRATHVDHRLDRDY